MDLSGRMVPEKQPCCDWLQDWPFLQVEHLVYGENQLQPNCRSIEKESGV